MKLGFLSAVTVATVLSASAAQAAIIVGVSNPGANTVTVGDLITVRVSASTDNPNGMGVLNVRVTESDIAINGAADATLFGAHITPLDGVPSGIAEAITATVNPALPGPSVTKPTATFVTAVGPTLGEPNSTTGNRPSFSFNGNTPADGRYAPQFYSAGNSTLTWFYDVTFVAKQVGTFYFSVNPNGPTGSEFTDPYVNSASPITKTTVVPTISGAGGFAVTINAGGGGDVNELVLATVATPTAGNNYVANAGTVNVVSSGPFTSSNVVTTDADKKAKGKVNVSWPGEAAGGPVWVMMWVTGTGTLPVPAGSTALYTTASHAGAGTMWDSLEADYSAAGGGPFNYLAYYANGQSAPTNGFYYDLVGVGTLGLDKIAIVPEPASLGLLALGALGLLSRKRR